MSAYTVEFSLHLHEDLPPSLVPIVTQTHSDAACKNGNSLSDMTSIL